jgi:hypothetical protein
MLLLRRLFNGFFHKLPATAYGLHRICADITCCSLRVSYRQQRRILAGDAAGVASGGFIGLVYRLRLSASIRAGYCRIIPTDIEAVYKFLIINRAVKIIVLTLPYKG